MSSSASLRARSLCVLLLIAIAASGAEAPADADLTSATGWWQPIDTKTGEALGLIRIYQQNGLFFGRVEPASPDDDRARRCTRCTDERRDQPVIGLVLIRNMRHKGDEYVGGDILDPDTGRIYGCKFRLTDGGRELIMRGFFGVSLFGRSQIWRRTEAPR